MSNTDFLHKNSVISGSLLAFHYLKRSLICSLVRNSWPKKIKIYHPLIFFFGKKRELTPNIDCKKPGGFHQILIKLLPLTMLKYTWNTWYDNDMTILLFRIDELEEERELTVDEQTLNELFPPKVRSFLSLYFPPSS